MKHVKRFFLAFGSIILLAYAVLQLFSFQSFPVAYGVSFSASHASSLGLNWQEAYLALLDELKPPRLRIAAEWNQVEKEPGAYAFQDLDWMMDEAARRDVQVVFVVGQKVPRWPECYLPHWFDPNARGAQDAFFSYVTAVVTRYREHPALAVWQVENEPFIRFPFGECEKFRSAWVAEEIDLVRELDSKHPILLTDSGELGLWWQAARHGDLLGTTVYRFVKTPGGREWRYSWLPAAWYRMRARVFGKSYDAFVISELQAEPWGNSSFTLEQLREHLAYARRTGASEAYLWGVEWWYWMKVKNGDARYWEIVQSTLRVYTEK